MTEVGGSLPASRDEVLQALPPKCRLCEWGRFAIGLALVLPDSQTNIPVVGDIFHRTCGNGSQSDGPDEVRGRMLADGTYNVRSGCLYEHPVPKE